MGIASIKDRGAVSICVIDETRRRGRRFHAVSRQKLSLTCQFGELRVN